MAGWAICTNRECRDENGNPTHWLSEAGNEETEVYSFLGLPVGLKPSFCPRCGQGVLSECPNEACRKPFDDSLGFLVTDVKCRYCGERLRFPEEKPMEPMM
jgi:hypothetical protein